VFETSFLNSIEEDVMYGTSTVRVDALRKISTKQQRQKMNTNLKDKCQQFCNREH